MSRVLVLGANGFLGRHAVAALRAGGQEVVPGPTRAELDVLADPDGLARLVRQVRPGAVVNATGRVTGSAADLEAGNVGTVQAVVAACAALGSRPTLVHLGSLAEYGQPFGRAFREGDTTRPGTLYGRSKLAATLEVVEAGAAGALRPVVLRVANPVGAGQPASTLAGAVLEQLRTAPDAPVRTGPLGALRDVVSARDVGRAVVAAVGATRPPTLVNIGTGRPVRMAELVRVLLEAARHTAGIVSTGAGSTRSGVEDVAYPDVALARTRLGFEAVDGLQAAVDDLFATVPQ